MGKDLFFLFIFQFADHLGHCTHGAECAPCPRLEQRHDRQPDNSGSEHKAVKPKAEFCDPVCHGSRSICPAPGNAECPQQLYCFRQVFRARCHQIRLEDHVAEHGEEEHQKSVSEPFGREKAGCGFVAGAFQASADLLKKLTAAAISVAEGFVSADDGNKQRDKKIDQPQPGKQNIEKAQRKINDRPDPEIVIPTFLLHHASSFPLPEINPPGQVFPHLPQPTHFSSSTTA